MDAMQSDALRRLAREEAPLHPAYAITAISMHPDLPKIIVCPDCEQMEIWGEAERADHGACRSRGGTCPVCGQPVGADSAACKVCGEPHPLGNRAVPDLGPGSVGTEVTVTYLGDDGSHWQFTGVYRGTEPDPDVPGGVGYRFTGTSRDIVDLRDGHALSLHEPNGRALASAVGVHLSIRPRDLIAVSRPSTQAGAE